MNLTISIVIVITLSSLFGWLAVRAGQAKSRPAVRWVGAGLAGLLAVLGVFVIGLALTGLFRFYLPAAAPAPELLIEGSPAQIARGERLAYLCASCHSTASNLPLDGSAENFSPAIGTIYAPNLTPGGPLQHWSDGEIMRAIREGVHQSGRALVLMPSDQFHSMSDSDVQALVVYLRTQPAVGRQTPATELTLLGAILVGVGMFPYSPQPPIAGPVEAPPAGETAAHGQYLLTMAGCRECHGADLRGGRSQFVPIGPNLLAILAQWSAEEFVTTIRTGVDPYGHALDPETMPWPAYAAAFEDEELAAIYTYIRTLPLTGEATE
ncbi:MAG: c-type cytochrome [Caldilineaceae bacterium]|nr:c-type cytochrome [Caldilineaceae bacterium]